MTRDRAAWILTAATALSAMLSGHACELALEAHHAFGGRLAPYAHVGQGPAGDLAIAGFAAALLMVAWRVLSLGWRRLPQATITLPPLDGVARSHPLHLTVRVIGMQLAALLAVESCEQQLSGFHGGVLGSIAGPGHWTALAVHILIGTLFARVVWLLARYTAARSRDLAGAVAAFVRRLHAASPARTIIAAQTPAHAALARKPALLSLGLANRPPPFSSASPA